MLLQKEQVVGQRYRIIEVIGKGGMAIVYKANDLKLGRDVTLKVLKADLIDDDGFIKRFSTEARAAAKLAHTNIVNVYDVGNDGDIYYIVMEYIDGITLKHLINRKGPLSNELAANIAMQIAAGLENAHENGVIHRDIKPENIMLTEVGDKVVAKVTDFGIAKANSLEITQGDYMGSVHYFSPEQAKGENVDRRSDIYSLGIVFFEMLTGVKPFEGSSAIEFAMKHIKSPLPDIKAINPNASKELIEIIKKACSKEPKNRYQSASEMEEAIRDVLPKLSKKNVNKAPVVADDDMGEYDDYDAEDDESIKIRERNIIITAILTGIVIIVLITIGGKIINNTIYGDTIKVPNFVGLTYEKASEKAEKKGLTIEREDIYQADVEAGDVARQIPEKGERVEKGSVVVLYVSFGPGDIQMPNIVGLRKSEGEKKLAELGLAIGDVEYVASDKPIGEILEQSPEFNEMVTPDVKVSIKVSKGEDAKEVPVPNLRLKTKEEVSMIMEDLGLNVKFLEGYSDSVEEGKVIDQGITPDTMVAVGSQITVTISKGKMETTTEIATIKVPAIVDITTTEAVTEATTEVVTEAVANKAVNIPVNPDKNILGESNNVRVVANKNGTEVVLKEITLGKDEFPFTVNDVSDGNTEYKVYINGNVVYSEIK